jgi:hypothetical protein
MKRIAALLVLVVLSGCASVQVTPASISGIRGRDEERAEALKTWLEAVWISNEFLASEYRKTLPQGTITLEEDGMAFVSDGARSPIRIKCSTAGDLLVPFKMMAQERSDGFVVGSLPPHQHREIDNTLFKHFSGSKNMNHHLAGLILHELAHIHFRLGTVSVPKTMLYYCEAIFLFRYRSHSMEIIPFRVSREFSEFVRAHSSE